MHSSTVNNRFQSQRFNSALHSVANFSCGTTALDDWLRAQPDSAAARGTSRTWVWLASDHHVVAYYALAAHLIQREEVPTRIGRGGPAQIPAVLITRLALTQELQSRGLGAALVVDALARILQAAKVVGVRLVVVEAQDEDVAGFYERLGFKRVPNSRKLVQKLSTIRAAFNS